MEKSIDETRRYLIHFLEEFKTLASEGRIWITNRKDTFNTLVELGYTTKDLETLLLSLTVEDYYAGPKQDIYRARDYYWEFGRVIKHQEYYIKIKIEQGERDERSVCLSFHRAERPMRFRFKNTGDEEESAEKEG